MNLCPRLSHNTIFGLFQQGDHSCAAGAGACEVYAGLNLRQHRSSGKLAFFNVFSGLGNRKIVQPFLIFFAEINGNFFHSRQNDQHICIQLLCEQAACEVFVNDCGSTF